VFTVELVDHPLEDADQDHRLASGVLQVLEQRDHLAGEQPEGAAGIRLPVLVRECLRPRLRPGHRLAVRSVMLSTKMIRLAAMRAARSG
jgi:hypothetical protein